MLDYRMEELSRRQENTRKLRESLSENKIDKKLREKISSFCDRHSLEFELVKHKMLIDDLFILSFITEPSRQTLHQDLASKFMANISNIQNFKVLPSNGKDSLFVINGMVVSESQKKDTSVSVKSIDFQWVYTNKIGEEINCYASHKYTHQGGGAQDHQFKEIMTFLDNAKRYSGVSCFFYAICDGQYYQYPYEGSLSRIEYLNKNYQGNRCCSLTINDIQQHMLNNL